jgi:Bacterial Ig-like domain
MASAGSLCQTTPMRRSPLYRLTALSQMLLLLAGCLSMQTTGKTKTQGEGGGVAVKIYADDDARKAGHLASGGIVGELERKDKGKWVPVFRSLDAQWTVLGLAPGQYRLRFPARLDDQGNVVAMDHTSEKQVRVKKGEVIQVETTLDHFPTALVAAGVVTAVVAAVVLHDWLKDHDLPLPPLPPPPPGLIDAVFYVAVDLSPGPEPGTVARRAPVVTSHFPEDGALVAARRIRLTFALSEPIDEDELESDAVAVLGETSGLVAGHVRYDPNRWWVIWEPDEDLPRNEVFHVTLAADAVENRAGHELAAHVSSTFKTTK